jgi:hypothetical protein
MAPIGLYLLKFPPPPNRAISWDQVFSTWAFGEELRSKL